MSSSRPRRSSARTRKPTARYTQTGQPAEEHAQGVHNTTNSEPGAEEQPRAAKPPHLDDAEATAHQTEELAPEDVAAPTVLADSLIGPTAADRLAIAEQHVKTLAEKSKSGYIGRLKTFQTYFLEKYREAKCEDAWDEIGKHLPTVSGLPGGLPRVWWKKGVYLTPERVDSYVAYLSLPFVGKDGRQKRRGASVISAHINALVFFHHVQCILRGIQVTGNLRTPAVRSCLRAAARQTANCAREEHLDRQENAVSDGYTDGQFVDILTMMLEDAAMHFLDKNDNKVYQALAMRAMSALQHVCLGRGDTSRGFNLCDIFTLVQETIGPTECVMLGLITDRGKHNKEGRKEIVGCIQHKDWRRCAIGALGVFLFYRYEILKEPFPDTRWRLPKDTYPDWAPFEGTDEEYEELRQQEPLYRAAQRAAFVAQQRGEQPEIITPAAADAAQNESSQPDTPSQEPEKPESPGTPSQESPNSHPSEAPTDPTDGAAPEDDSSAGPKPVPASWYQYWLFPSKAGSPLKPFDFEQHYTYLLGVFASLGICSSKVTHAFRGVGAREGDLGGLSEMEVARLGHWVFAHMILSYLTNIPAEALLVMGGFPPIKKAYHVPRFHVAVPSGLPKIFAKADFQLEEVNRRHDIINRFKAQRKAVPKMYERDISAQNFLKALTGPLRKITLQHLALIYHHVGSDHPLCHHPLMEPGSEHFEAWEQFVEAVVEADARSNEATDGVERPEVLVEEVKAGVDAVASDVRQLQSDFTRRMDELLQQMDRLLRTVPDQERRPSPEVPVSNREAHCNASGNQPGDQAAGPGADAAGAARPVVRKAVRKAATEVENVYSVPFLQQINTVAQAWRLFKHGLNGKESIEALKAKSPESKQFRYADRAAVKELSRLNTVVKFVQDKIEKFGLTPEEAITYGELLRKDVCGTNGSLRTFIDACPGTQLRSKRKAGTSDDIEAEIRSAPSTDRKAAHREGRAAKYAKLVEDHFALREELGLDEFREWLKQKDVR